MERPRVRAAFYQFAQLFLPHPHFSPSISSLLNCPASTRIAGGLAGMPVGLGHLDGLVTLVLSPKPVLFVQHVKEPMEGIHPPLLPPAPVQVKVYFTGRVYIGCSLYLLHRFPWSAGQTPNLPGMTSCWNLLLTSLSSLKLSCMTLFHEPIHVHYPPLLRHTFIHIYRCTLCLCDYTDLVVPLSSLADRDLPEGSKLGSLPSLLRAWQSASSKCPVNIP